MPALSIRWLSLLCLAPFCVSAAEVLIVTDRSHPVRAAAGARIIELDRAARIEAELSSGLPSDPDRAAEIARQRLNDRHLQGRLFDAYQGIAEAKRLDITRIPAVVVDRRFVIHGEPDVARALARIEAYRSTQP